MILLFYKVYTGQFADKITSQELRYIKENWDKFKDVITFWKEGMEVVAPW